MTSWADLDFFRIARRWIREQAYGNGDTAEFIALAERVSGEDLGDFFDLWVYTPERPPPSAVTPGADADAAAARDLRQTDTDARAWVEHRKGLGAVHD